MAIAKSMSLLKPHTPTGAAVDAAFAWFDFFDDFHGADFGCAGECAGGECGGEDIHVGNALFQTTFDVGNDVHHMGVFFNHHLSVTFDFAPVLLMRPTSLRPKSISMTCSAILCVA